jgi:hypothetical protein
VQFCQAKRSISHRRWDWPTIVITFCCFKGFLKHFIDAFDSALTLSRCAFLKLFKSYPDLILLKEIAGFYVNSGAAHAFSIIGFAVCLILVARAEVSLNKVLLLLG